MPLRLHIFEFMRFSVFLTLFLSLFSLTSQAAAPLCQGIFFRAEISNSVAPMIRELADLRLQLDTWKTENNSTNSIIYRTLQSRYPVLVGQILQQGIYSEAHLNSLIRAEILHLQNRKQQASSEESIKESSRRTLEEEALLIPQLALEAEAIRANETSIFAQANAFYVPGTDKVIYAAHGSFKLSVLHGQSAMSFPAETMTPNSSGLGIYAKRGKLLMTLSDQGRLTGTYEINFVSDHSMRMEFDSMQLSKDGTQLLMKGTQDGNSAVISVIDTHTKKEIFFNEKIKMDEITDATYLDNDLLAVVNSRELRVVQISTGNEIFKRELNMPGVSAGRTMQVHLSSDHKNLIVSNDFAIQSLDASKLDGETVTISDSSEIKRRRIYTVPNMPHQLIEVNGKGVRILNTKSLNVEFNFDSKYQSLENKVMAVAPSLQGDKIVLIYWPDSSDRKNVRADIWKVL